MENKLKEQKVETYADFISNIYRYDNDNVIHYEKVEGLMEAMRKIYKGYGANDYFLMVCIVKEINKVLRKLEKK
jgi:hypothetical protein